jgi:hypothetical protein
MASRVGTAKVWTLFEGGGRELMILSAQDTRGGIDGVAFSPDGSRVMTGNRDISATRIWDVGRNGHAEVTNLVMTQPGLPAATCRSRRLVRPIWHQYLARTRLPSLGRDSPSSAPPPAHPRRATQGALPDVDDEERWAIARRLVTDDTIPTADRVAGALVVLYAQPLARIARLTPSDLHRRPDATTMLILDGNLVPIHEPIAGLIERLPARRHNGVTEQLASPWLFPGNHAGRPIPPTPSANDSVPSGSNPEPCSATRAQLAAEIPPAMLGEIIGVSATTATRWAALTAGN